MHILITNDDGVLAPGLAALVRAFEKGHQVSILAPDRNWSASGHAKTMHRHLRVWETELADGTPALMTNGTPSDCVSLAALGLVTHPIDAVVSGINPLSNMGYDVSYSGTVAAAMEAVILGLIGFAVSLDAPEDPDGVLDYAPAAEITLKLVEKITSRPSLEGILFNINVPYKPPGEIQGVKIAKQGKSVYQDRLTRRQDPRGQSYYWLGGDRPKGIHDPGTDFSALAEGFVSVTPLQMDFTAHASLQNIEDWSLDLFS
jgi:5'-nucleotidase